MDDDDAMTTARGIVRNLGVSPRHPEYDDCVQECLIAMWRSSKSVTFDPATGDFDSYRNAAGANAVRDVLRARSRRREWQPLDDAGLVEAIGTDGTGEVWEVIRSLCTEREVAVCEARFIHGKELRVYAAEIGIPFSTVGTWNASAMHKIRDHIRTDGVLRRTTDRVVVSSDNAL